MPRAVATTTKSLKNLLRHVDEGELVLPEIQRDFVWNRKSVMFLFDSLFRGLPIGQMLVWKATRLVSHRGFRVKRGRSAGTVKHFYGYLLDGQQRLTALARVRDADENYRLMFYAYPKRAEEELGLFDWQNRSNAEDAWYVDVADVLQGRFDKLGYLREIQKDPYFERGMEKAIDEDLEALKRVLDYEISVIEFDTEDYREATELFIRFNSTGKKLSRADLFLADLAVQVPGIATNEIQRAAQKWPGYSFTVPFLAQCLLAVHSGRMNLKAKDPWSKEDPDSVKESWKRTERGLAHVVRFLTGTVRWPSSSLVPSFNALIPLAAIAAERDGLLQREQELARRWLLLSAVHAHFSGAVHTELDRILRLLQQGYSVKTLWASTYKQLKKLKPADFEVSRISGPVTSAYLSMLAENDARDWVDRNCRLNGTVQGHNAQLHVHHFFPRSLLKKHGKSQAEFNTFGNYTIISAAANLNVGTEEPGTYMKRLQVPETQLERQCIPLDESLWRVNRYDEFLDERRKLLADRLNEFMGMK
jgi:hypothetical protein